MMSLDIVIPVYNEKENIIPVLESLAALVKTGMRVLIVYDRDDDDTLPPVRRFKEKDAFEIELVKNWGKGPHAAVLTGFEKSDAPAILVFPADDTFNAGIIDGMYAKFREGCDIVAASRFMNGGCMTGCPPLKSVLVRLASFTLHLFAGLPVHDATSGFRLFSKRLIDTVRIESTEGFTYSLELLVKCRRLGWKMAELPAAWHERTKGRSRFKTLGWIGPYLRWYFYAFATRILRRGPATVKTRTILQNKDAEKALFDKFGVANPYDVFDERGYDRILKEFFKHLQPYSGMRAVDLGCGTGAFTSRLLRYGFGSLSGIDISGPCVAYARSRYPAIGFDMGDIEKTPYPSEAFDAVFLSGVLHHFPDFSGVMAECRRILKPGGVLLAYDPNRHNPFMRLFRCKDSPFYVSKGVTPNERPLAREEIVEGLKKNGFFEYKVYAVSGVTFRRSEGAPSFAVPVYNIVERILDIGPLREAFGSFLITYARKR